MGNSARHHRSQTAAESLPEKNNTTDCDLTGKDWSDDLHSSDSETESNSSSDSGTESNRSSDSKTSMGGLSAIIRVLSDSLLRTEIAEMEMMKAREAARLEAEKRRFEMEVELTRMMLQTHLQATASLLAGKQKTSLVARRKRKRSEIEEDESFTTREKSLALLSLLQLNLIFWNSLT